MHPKDLKARFVFSFISAEDATVINDSSDRRACGRDHDAADKHIASELKNQKIAAFGSAYRCT